MVQRHGRGRGGCVAGRDAVRSGRCLSGIGGCSGVGGSVVVGDDGGPGGGRDGCGGGGRDGDRDGGSDDGGRDTTAAGTTAAGVAMERWW